MANQQLHGTGGHGLGGLSGGTDPFGHPLPPVVDPPPMPPPIDPDELIQIELLNEAVLNSFAADTNPCKPFEPNRLRWNITMPVRTFANAGVPIDVQLVEVVEGSTNPGYADQLPPVGSRPAAIRKATTWTLVLVAPKTSRALGSVTIDVDMSGFQHFVADSFLITKPVESRLSAGFPPGGQITLRTPATVAVHLEVLTVDLALSVDGPAFYNPDASVSVSWTLFGHGQAWNDPPDGDARIECDISTATTKVDIGFGYTALSLGVANAVAAAVEGVSDGYLSQLVGPLIAQDIVELLTYVMNEHRPSGWVFHHLDVVPDGLTFWYCPRSVPTHGGSHQPPTMSLG
ncbi:MAG: hypothetical protein ACJ74U_16655 [Jatrophihabitantaceae bacterium]